MKTRLYTRKRALISSVAMLLVAMIALGTATFAWFTSNPNANARGLQLKATAAKGLVIQTESHKTLNPNFWDHDDYLNINDGGTASKSDAIALSATSFDLTSAASLGTATKVDASADNSYAAGAGYVVTSANAGTYNDTTGKDYYTEKVYCKLNGTGDTSAIRMTGLKIKIADGATSEALLNTIRVAVEYVDVTTNPPASEGASATETKTSKLVGVYSLGGLVKAHGFLKGYNASKTNYFTSAPDGTPGTAGTDYYLVSVDETNTKFKSAIKVAAGANGTASPNGFTEPDSIGTVDKTGKDYFQLTVYLDGQHEDCTTNNIGNAATLISSIELNLTVADKN